MFQTLQAWNMCAWLPECLLLRIAQQSSAVLRSVIKLPVICLTYKLCLVLHTMLCSVSKQAHEQLDKQANNKNKM